MALGNRLRELVEGDKQDLAETLARSAVHTDEVTKLFISNDILVIKMERFVARHPIDTDVPDNEVEFEKGTYEWRGDEVSFTFNRRNIPAKIEAQAKSLVKSKLSEADEDSSRTIMG